MKLKEYLDMAKIDPAYFASKIGVTRAAIYYYLSGKRKPHQSIAEKIEDITFGMVTVLELRGKDVRQMSSRLKS